MLADVLLALLPAQTITAFGLKQSFGPHPVAPELKAMYLREARRPRAIAALKAQERQLVPANPEAWERAHEQVRCPTLILWGENDKLVPLAQAMKLQSAITTSGLVVFPAVGHSPQIEEPARVLAQLLPFLRQVDSR